MNLKVHKRENLYLVLKIFFSLLGVYLVWIIVSALTSSQEASVATLLMTFVTYLLVIFIYVGALKIFMIGYLKGNGIEIGPKQFPEVDAILKSISEQYRMKKIPKLFLVQSGGVLNAYATRFGGKDYIAIYSDVFAMVEKDLDVLKFILAHEMAHVKQRHIQKRFWTFLSFYVPFLGAAYSRACEHTCDQFAYSTTSEGATRGLMLLAAGKDLYGKVNIEEYLENFKTNNTFVVRFVEKFLGHPNLPKRIEYLQNN